jgi:hypothetical protein
VITGFNTNVRYSGRVFHVQTEDSGLKNPHIISHLYFGGTILASQKSSYAEHVESANREAEVRALMEAQHKSMLRRLKNAEFDAVIAERLADTPPDAPSDAASDAPVGDATTSPSLVDAAPPQPAPGAAQAEPTRDFGTEVVSEKPLDEVILEYLVAKARDRAGRPPPRAGRSRSSAKE